MKNNIDHGAIRSIENASSEANHNYLMQWSRFPDSLSSIFINPQDEFIFTNVLPIGIVESPDCWVPAPIPLLISIWIRENPPNL